MSSLKPMLAASIEEKDLDNLKYPVITQPKLDGIRCLLLEGRCLSRTLKPIPNHHIRNQLRDFYFVDDLQYLYDGELILKDKSKSFQSSVSGIMTREGSPDFEYVVFDGALTESELSRDYEFRRPKLLAHNIVKSIPEFPCLCKDDVLSMHKRNMELGFEGTIIRSLFGKYKFGRSTVKEQLLLKLKDFEDAEAIIIDFEEQMINNNEPTLDERGYTNRSSHQAGMIPANTLGALICKGINGQFKGVEFNVGSGFSDAMRKSIWENRVYYEKKTITYQYQRCGSMDKPRILTFKGFRINE